MTVPGSPPPESPSADTAADDTCEPADDFPGQDPLDVEAARWLVRRHDGLSRDEEAELQRWLAADPERQRRLDGLGRLWGRLGALPPDDVAALKAASAPAPRASGRSVPSLRPPRPPRWLPGLALACVLVLLVGSGAWGWAWWADWRQQPLHQQALATVRGQQSEVLLPDGSRLKLDTATRAEVALYRQRREVRLVDGQVMFDVQADATRPFDVLAGPLRVTVRGTRFSVRHTRSGLGAEGVVVAVEEGRVHVQALSTGAQEAGGAGTDEGGLDLRAGQAAAVDATGRWAVAPVTASALAWHEGRLVLDGVALADVLAEFARYRETGLVVNDPAVAALRLNGRFDLRQFDAFLRALPQVLPVRLRGLADGRTEVVMVP